MCKILEELWHSDIVSQNHRTDSQEMTELIEFITRHHDELQKNMTDEQKQILEKFDDCWSEYLNLSEKSIFIYAFKLGARLTLETFIEKDAC